MTKVKLFVYGGRQQQQRNNDNNAGAMTIVLQTFVTAN